MDSIRHVHIQHYSTQQQYTPFELIFGYQATLSSALTKSPNSMYCYDDYVKELKERLWATNRIAREHIIKAKLTAKLQYDKDTKAISFKLGDKILFLDEILRRDLSKKLDLLWTGPYEIISCQLQDKNRMKN